MQGFLVDVEWISVRAGSVRDCGIQVNTRVRLSVFEHNGFPQDYFNHRTRLCPLAPSRDVPAFQCSCHSCELPPEIASKYSERDRGQVGLLIFQHAPAPNEHDLIGTNQACMQYEKLVFWKRLIVDQNRHLPQRTEALSVAPFVTIPLPNVLRAADALEFGLPGSQSVWSD